MESKSRLALVAVCAIACGDVEIEPDGAVGSDASIGADAPTTADANTGVDATVFDASPGAPDAAQLPDAAPNVSFDLVVGSEFESNLGSGLGSGVSTRQMLYVVNTGDVALDLGSLRLASQSGNAPPGTQVILSCTAPNPGSVVLQPGEGAGHVSSALSQYTEPLLAGVSVVNTTATPCQIDLKFFNAGGWVTFGKTGTIEIAGHAATFTIGVVERASSNSALTWTAATRVSSN